MQVNLKESEIARAVELYLNRHGIKTRGKTVTIQFSMGKGANGLRTEIDIEGLDDNVEIPGFTAHDREVPDTPIHLLASVQDEPEIIPGTVGALLKNSRQEFAEKLAAVIETGEAVGAALVAEHTIEVEAQADEPEIPAELVEEAEATGAPWNDAEAEAMAHMQSMAAAEPDITEDVDALDAAVAVPAEVETAEEVAVEEVVAEAALEPDPEPVVEVAAKPVPKVLFAKKAATPAATAAKPEPVAEAATSLIPEEVAPEAAVVAAAATTGPVRRSLFKKSPA